MNAKKEKGSYYVNSPNDPQLFELLNYVKFLCKWRDQSRSYGNKYFYFADSTHQDTLWVALSLVYVARRHLPKGESINQSNLGTDHLERSFSLSREKNAHANAQGTDGQMANIGGQTLMHLSLSKGANTRKKRTFKSDAIDEMKVKRTRLKYHK